MKNKNDQKTIIEIIKNVALFGIVTLCIVNFITLLEVKNNLPDTFFAYDVSYIINNNEEDPHYTMMFEAVSAQGKTYPDNDLVFIFKCYDENAVLIDDSVQALVKKGDFSKFQAYKSDILGYDSRINYCELNFVRILHDI